MFYRDISTYFIKENKDNLLARMFLCLSSIVIAFSGAFIVTPLYVNFLLDKIVINHSGLSIFLSHFLIGLPATLSNIIFLLYLIKKEYYKPFVSFNKDKIKKAMLYGLIGGLFISILITFVWYLTGNEFKFEISLYKNLGDVFSNFYEELGFRVLVMSGFLYLFRNRLLAIMGSSIIFGLVHQQYSIGMMLLVMFDGVIYSLLYLKTRNVIAPWFSHQISDLILDSILVV